MSARTILFPTDLSPASGTALDYATSLARDMDATLLIVHVDEPQSMFLGDTLYLPPASVPNPELERMLRAVVPADEQIRCEHLLLLGSPAEEILNLAEQRNVGLIVLGTHGRTGLSRLLMGSVAEAVVRRAACPVLSVKAMPASAEQKQPRKKAEVI